MSLSTLPGARPCSSVLPVACSSAGKTNRHKCILQNSGTLKDCENRCLSISRHKDSEDPAFRVGYRTQSEPTTWSLSHIYSSEHEGKGVNRERESENKQRDIQSSCLEKSTVERLGEGA